MTLPHIRAILFDIDGTLLDTADFIVQSFHSALTAHALPLEARQKLLKRVGPPLEEVYRALTGLNDPTSLIDAHRAFQKTHLHLSRTFPRTYDTVQTLFHQGKKLAAVTTRSRENSSLTLEQAGILPFFDSVISAED